MSAKTSKEHDPVAAAIANAPVGEPMTEAERVALEEARASIARGDRTYTQEEIEARIAERRRQAGE